MMDASRALEMCQANYYAHQMGVTLPGLDGYCYLWGNKYMNNVNSAPIQFTPSGTAGSSQSGYFAQGLEALFQSGGHNTALFAPTLDSALNHYSSTTKTFDRASCFGVYTEAFSVRALGMGIGRDLAAFTAPGTVITTPIPPVIAPVVPIANPSPNTTQNISSSSTGTATPITPASSTSVIASLAQSCVANNVACTLKSDVTSGACRTILYGTSLGDIKVFACTKTGGYVEIYKQQAPTTTFKVCLANGCVSNANGFARFIPIVSTQTTQPSSATGDTTTTTPSVPPQQTPPPINPPVATSPSTYTVMGLSMTVLPSGTLISDTADGSTCRIVKYSTPNGEIDGKVCNKGANQYNSNNYEMYQLTTPNGAQICFANTCIGTTSGYATFSN